VVESRNNSKHYLTQSTLSTPSIYYHAQHFPRLRENATKDVLKRSLRWVGNAAQKHGQWWWIFLHHDIVVVVRRSSSSSDSGVISKSTRPSHMNLVPLKKCRHKTFSGQSIVWQFLIGLLTIKRKRENVPDINRGRRRQKTDSVGPLCFGLQ